MNPNDPEDGRDYAPDEIWPDPTIDSEVDKILNNYWADRKNNTGTEGGAHRKARRRLIHKIAQEANKARIDEASHYCDLGCFHDKDRDLAMLPSERVAELTAEKGKADE